MPSNRAAWITGGKEKLLQVKEAPYTPPRSDEIVIKGGAVAINPIDWLQLEMGSMVFPWIKYPFIIGSDVAGEVVEVGSGITHFKVGDRVVGHAGATNKERNRAAEGAFQEYTVLAEHMTAHIPPSMSFESASVIPLGASTAACGLFEKDQLNLQYPTNPPREPTGKTVLIWGGSTSVGCNAIQLARAAGYDVISTSSPRNFEMLRQLGAQKVFDYNSPTVVEDVVKAFRGRTSAGALAIGAGAADACMDILHRVEGIRFIAMATYPVPSPPPARFVMPRIIYSFASWSIQNAVKSRMRSTKTAFVSAFLIFNGVGKAVYQDYLSSALVDGSFKPAPVPLVVGSGVESIQAAFDRQREGVSAKKVVVSL
jgi:NADPH:quinone reductase-like Zn-dependent oxidoreductase